MVRWLHALQLFQFSIVHRPSKDHDNADGLLRVPSSPCRQCAPPDCPPVFEVSKCANQPFDYESTSSSEDADLVPIHSGENWIALLDDDLSQPLAVASDSFRISTIQGGSGLHHTVIVDFIGNFSDLGRDQGLVPGTAIVVASS